MLDFLNFLVENKNVLLTFLLFIFFGFIIFVYLPYYFSATTNRLLYRVKLLKDFTEDELANSPKVKDIIRVVDNICSNYSLPRPDVGIYPSAILNAFTVGPKNRSLIAISSSLVNSMSLSEIRGVLGHEIAHIINHDNFRHHFFQGFLQLVSSFFISLIDRNLISPWLRKKKRRTKNWAFYTIIWIGTSLFIRFIYFVFGALENLIFFSYNRQREYIADQVGAKIIGVDNVLNALKKFLILREDNLKVDGLHLSSNNRYTLDLLLGINGRSNYLFCTHPPLEDRISRLEKLRGEIGKFGNF